MSEQINTTKDGIEVKPKQVWVSTDKRDRNRRVTVVSVENGKAKVTSGVRTSTVSVSRMHHHSTGYRLVKDA